MLNYIVVIPARMSSTRLPGKPLIDLLGQTMIQRVYNRCLEAVPKDLIYIATDDIRIKVNAESFGANVIMTSDRCLTGTDRVGEVAMKISAKYYINVQGDEPLFNPLDISVLIESLDFDRPAIYMGYSEITEESDFRNRSIPKLVYNNNFELIYISRESIPGNKNGEFVKSWRQVCAYAFSRQDLLLFYKEDRKHQIEEIEDIEILRFLELGCKVKMVRMSDKSIAVDNEHDVERVLNVLKNV